MADAELIEQLRRALPRLLREHPEVRHELWGLMLEAFPSRQEFLAFLEELRALREESNRRFEGLQHEIAQRFEAMDRRFETLLREMNQRFEAVDRRFEAVDRRFEGVIGELREQRLHLSALGARVGRGL
jgi:tetrahydromethanopterin S-methyltransferase subunit G